VKSLTSCFVIMPFSKTNGAHTEQYWTNHFDNFLKPLIEENGSFAAHRSRALRGDIVRQIITNLVTSPIVVADLTDANSNVHWELGVRHSFKHGTITIAEEGTELPFDIGAQGTLFYNTNDYIKMNNFRTMFKTALTDCLARPDRLDSHVLEAVAGRGSLYELVWLDEAIRRIEALLAELTYNQLAFSEIMKIVSENKKLVKKRKRNDCSYSTSLLRTAATELLMTTRYLEQDPNFYADVEKLYTRCVGINVQVGIWESSPDGTEDWFEEVQSETKNWLVTIQNRLAKAHSELQSRL
jgi:hypothetical protein